MVIKLCQHLRPNKVRTKFFDVWEGLNFFFFVKNSIFNEHLPPKDDVRDKIWCQILLTLSTEDLEYLIGF